MLEDGVHYLSGVETCVSLKNPKGWDDDEMVDADLFVIDGVTYAAYIDPADGYRSYGVIAPTTEVECKFTFPPQKVIVEHRETNEDSDYGDECHNKVIVIKDAYLNKEVLIVGTDYSFDYYPMAIFHYNPMNLYVNVEKSMQDN